MRHESYIAPGSHENWRIAFANGNVWGLPEGREHSWRLLKRGDAVFFYVESPFSGVAGVGEIQEAYYDGTPFFADDGRAVSNWPFRFHFRIILASGNLSATNMVSVADMLRFPRLKRFEALRRHQAEELLRRCDAEIKRQP